MFSLRKYSLSLSLNKKLVMLMLFLSITLTVTFIILYYKTEETIFLEFEQKIAEISRGIQIGVEQMTSGDVTDIRGLKNYLEKLNAKGVTEISIISNSDRIISSTNTESIGKWITKSRKDLIFKAELGEPVTGAGQTYDIIVPVVAGKKHFGYIHVTVNADDFAVHMKQRVVKRITATVIILGIGLVMTLVLARRYTRPIEDVVAAARNVAAGDLDHELKTNRKDEIGELADSFNYMIIKLRKQRELEERLRRAEHLAGIGQFSRSIAHEIKNPLNFISLSIDHMREKYRPPVEQDRQAFNSLIDNIKSEIQRVSRFAESFLEYSRPLELSLQMIDLNSLIIDIIEITETKANREHIRIEKSLGELPLIPIDPEFLKTCLYNIVLNAFQAMPKGGILRITTGKHDSSVRVMITDTGTGIPEDKMKKIFEPFFTTKTSGLGLGLALTKRIVEEHRGSVELSSEYGKGTKVSIILPVERKNNSAADPRG